MFPYITIIFRFPSLCIVKKKKRNIDINYIMLATHDFFSDTSD